MKTPEEALKDFVNDQGSLRSAARKLGFSPTFLSFVMRGETRMTQKLAKALGFDLVKTQKWIRKK